MRPIRDIQGLKFPDEYVIRWVFKRGLDRRVGAMLELGCGSGANLMLAEAYGWDAWGVDRDGAALEQARFNLGAEARLIEADLGAGFPAAATGPFQAAMLPNVLCYLGFDAARDLLAGLRERLAPNAEVFVRTRTPQDHRCGRGEEIAPLTWRLDTPETGEAGLINRFYRPEELGALLEETLGLEAPTVLRARFDNPQSGVIVTNDDVVIWGVAS